MNWWETSRRSSLRWEETHVATFIKIAQKNANSQCWTSGTTNLSILHNLTLYFTAVQWITTRNMTNNRNRTEGEKKKVVIVLWTIRTASTASVSGPTLRLGALRWHDISSISALQGNKWYNKQMTAIVYVTTGKLFARMRGCVALSTSPLYPSISCHLCHQQHVLLKVCVLINHHFHLNFSLQYTQTHTQLITQC